jgi:hypothetical protein
MSDSFDFDCPSKVLDLRMSAAAAVPCNSEGEDSTAWFNELHKHESTIDETECEESTVKTSLSNAAPKEQNSLTKSFQRVKKLSPSSSAASQNVNQNFSSIPKKILVTVNETRGGASVASTSRPLESSW